MDETEERVKDWIAFAMAGLVGSYQYRETTTT